MASRWTAVSSVSPCENPTLLVCTGALTRLFPLMVMFGGAVETKFAGSLP